MRRLITGILAVFLSLSFVGCRQLQRDLPRGEEDMITPSVVNGTTSAEIMEKQIQITTTLRDVIVVIRGQEVFVGIDLQQNSNYGSNLVQRIEEVVKADSRYTYVYITNEHRSVESLRSIRQAVLEGNQVEDYNTQLNKIKDSMTI